MSPEVAAVSEYPIPEKQEDEPSQEGSTDTGPSGMPLWEKILAAMGLALLMATLAFLLYRGISGVNSPPEITVRPLGVTPQQSGYLVRVEVRNSGGSTAAQVKVSGVLRRGAEDVETREATLDYVPQDSHRDLGLFFTQDPRKFDLEVYPEGYAEP